MAIIAMIVAEIEERFAIEPVSLLEEKVKFMPLVGATFHKTGDLHISGYVALDLRLGYLNSGLVFDAAIGINNGEK